MDCNMPVMDGYDATLSIRKLILSKQILQPIICAVTGHIEPKYVKKCYESGMNAVFSKPVDRKLIEALSQKLNYLNYIYFNYFFELYIFELYLKKQ